MHDTPPPPLARLEIDVPAADADAAAAVPWRIGAQGVAIRDASTGDAPPGRAVICTWTPAAEGEATRLAAEQHLGPLRARATLRLVPEDPRGWRDALTAPVTVGGFVITADDGPSGRDGRRRLRLEPGSAFGGGGHPTTALCVRAFEARFAHRPPARVLDVGTGTGVLALVAATLGARRVIATDIDPLARHAAQRHARDNGLADRIDVRAELPDGRFELVVANLYLDPLVALAPALAARLAAGGRCIVSGIAARHRPRVERAFVGAGLRPVDRAELDGWIALEFAGPGDEPPGDASDRTDPEAEPDRREAP